MAASNNSQKMLKDPNAYLPFEISWENWLEDGETIATSTWTPTTGITAGASSKTDTAATVWLSGGTVKTDYECFNTITTSGGRTERAMIKIQVR